MKTLTAHVQRKNAERELFTARRKLSHLIEIYNTGQWRRLYSEAVFANMVRQAKESVLHWTELLSQYDCA